MRLSDSIEQFIKDLLKEESTEVELKRNELAEYFGCAPSQINYVLATRFSPDHGYLTESRRGGGGYIRIVRVVRSGSQRLMLMDASVSARALGVPVPDALKDAMRAKMMKSMLMTIAARNRA